MKARDNPFRTERVLQIRYRLDGIGWEELCARLEQMEFRGALVGPHGSGKTTLLEDLEGRLRERGFGTRVLRLSEEQRSFAPAFLDDLFAEANGRDIILFDGAEQLNPVAWRRFRWRSRKAGGLIITTHSPGRLPTLYECCTDEKLLAELSGELFGVEPESMRALAEVLFRRHQGNIRGALREFYDLAAADHPLPSIPLVA